MTIAVPEPALFVAVTVYAVDVVAAVGVPDIKPVVLLIVKPAGRVGEIVILSTVSVTVAVSGVIAVLVMPDIVYDL